MYDFFWQDTVKSFHFHLSASMQDPSTKATALETMYYTIKVFLMHSLG